MSAEAHLRHQRFLVLLFLRDFDWRQPGHRRNQKVHQDVFAVGHAVHRGQNGARDIVGEQEVVIPGINNTNKASALTTGRH